MLIMLWQPVLSCALVVLWQLMLVYVTEGRFESRGLQMLVIKVRKV
jgi:hypothetical protein